jgi:serine/threonine protein kinase
MSKTSFDEYPRATKDDEPTEIANWNILHVIGAGGMGLVFHGNSPDHTKAAIKIIKPELISSELIRRFESEISAHQLINSPYVAKMLESSLDHDPAYMAIEFIHGLTLAQIIENNVKISEKLWLVYAKQVFLGLEQIHARGLVHRDIKPANIMKLEDKEMIKIIDLGIVKNEERQSLNRTKLIGTLPYMSPEQLLGKSATQKSDIFSAGVTLVELFTKKHPFLSSGNWDSLDEAIIENEPDLEDFSSNLKSFCEKLLKKNPSERITATEAISFLDSSIKSIFENARRLKRPVVKKPVVAKKIPASKPIDPALIAVLDEFNPETDSIIQKGSLQYMTVGVSTPKNFNIKPSKLVKSSYEKDLISLYKINSLFLNSIGSKIFHINFYSTKFKSEVYFQGFIDKNGRLLVEAVSDDFLGIKFDQDQRNLLINLGWAAPYSTNPNYSMQLANTNAGRDEAAKVIAETALLIYGVTKESEIFLSPINEKLVKEIKEQTSISLSSDGSFVMNSDRNKEDQYSKWQIIGFFERDDENDLILETLVARHRENNKVYKREKKTWKYVGVFENPVKNGINKIGAKNGFVFNKKIINVFDKSELEKEYLTFEGTTKFLDYVPELSAKYLDQEKIWPLTNDMIELGNDTASDFDDFLGLFTLSSSNVNKNVVLGLFAKHPQNQKFYGRTQGKWKLLFESPLTYGHEIFFVNKKFIDFFDTRSQKPEKPIRHSELEEFIHNPDFEEVLPIPKVNMGEKIKYSQVPPALQKLIKDMISRVEDKIGQEDADIATEVLRAFMTNDDFYSQSEISSQMAKLLRLLT